MLDLWAAELQGDKFELYFSHHVCEKRLQEATGSSHRWLKRSCPKRHMQTHTHRHSHHVGVWTPGSFKPHSARTVPGMTSSWLRGGWGRESPKQRPPPTLCVLKALFYSLILLCSFKVFGYLFFKAFQMPPFANTQTCWGIDLTFRGISMLWIQIYRLLCMLQTFSPITGSFHS